MGVIEIQYRSVDSAEVTQSMAASFELYGVSFWLVC
jgi:hypothetical protein